MRRNICTVMLFVSAGLVSMPSLAKDAIVNVDSEGVERTENRLAIAVALPASVLGKRIDRAILEVPIALGESADSVFNDLPIIELYEYGSEAPKQTILLAKGFDGIARFDVTRFVRTWVNTNARGFVLGAVSEQNETALTLGAASLGATGVKARLSIEYRDRDGTSVSVDAE